MRALLASSVVVVGVLVLFGASQGEAQEQPQLPPPPPARKIPGINAEDPAPNGCVSCHTYDPKLKMDSRFSTWLPAWHEKGAPERLVDKAKRAAPKGMKIEGRHPKLKVDLTTARIPDTCLECHSRTPKDKKMAGPPFAQLIHLVHLTGGEKNHFMTYYQGECTACHKLDQKSGQWGQGSGTEAEVAKQKQPQK